MQLVRLVSGGWPGSGPGPAVRARARGQWSGLGLGFKRPLVRHALQPTIVLPSRRAKDEAASVEVQVARPGGAWVA